MRLNKGEIQEQVNALRDFSTRIDGLLPSTAVTIHNAAENLNKLSNENAELRAFALEVWNTMQFAIEMMGLTDIKVNGESISDSIPRRMRELGIEVTNVSL